MLKAIRYLRPRQLVSSPTTNTFSRNMSDSKPPSTAPLALPSSETATKDSPTTLKVGSTATMDALGPVVINVDGTISRINNWAELSEIEKQNTLRILGKRNRERREVLLAKAAESEAKKDGEAK
ncbi:hypothetical protein B0T11DRAFT_291173 [Plectosphaerella cucumerina]|uniref:Uncharacterized protein n=1 Tax=Plectosphaerella cucumerina TaxID=40658 RepID=A0A8K0TA09_9PEZI|nr:hypothetical protein B0T11DRAFT_291173 [Plectosphaerella cucumerina]